MQRFQRIVVGIIQVCDADADTHRLLDPISCKVIFENMLHASLRHLSGALGVYGKQNGCKLVAAQSVKTITRSQRTMQRLGQSLKHLIADWCP